MQYFFSEINRTDSEVRAILNSKLRDKRIIFEEMIIRSVRELLNSNNTALQLEDKQNILNKLTSTRRRRAKERFEKATSALQQSTQSAPIGIGSAAGIALNAASTANEIYYERSEQKILERAAEESLNAAKFNIYTPHSDNYSLIAKTVARELSFALQPLLLVLAAGQNGIVKLAEFTEKSRKKYAVEKLPEYHSTNSVSEIANALIDASIPPISDVSFYRNFFKVNAYHLDVHLGKHTTLSFDPEVRSLLKLVGLDTEIFFGRLDVDQYTIIGALNHAVFLGQNYQLYAGIETKHRIGELLTGTLKYPLRLLAPDRNIGTTGVSFAPRPTGIYLEQAHVEVLKKLFPNFSDPSAVIVSAEELAEDKVILPDYATRKYRSERNSVPWNLKRTDDMKQRSKAVLSASIKHSSPDDICSIPDYDRLKTMRDAGDNFDISYSKMDLLAGAAKTHEAQINSFGAFDTLNKRRMLLISAKHSKYLAITTSNYVYCLIKSESSTFADLILATQMLDYSRTALNLSRNHPIIEVNHIQKAKITCRKSITEVEESAILQMENYKILLLLADKFRDTIKHHDFLNIIPRLIAWKKKSLNNKHSIVCEELANIKEFISALTNYSFMAEDREELTETEAIAHFKEAANLVIEQLYSINNADNAQQIINKIDKCVLEMQIINYEITTILENQETKPDNFRDIKRSINEAFQTASGILTETKNQVSSATWLWKKTHKNRLLARLRGALSHVRRYRDICETFLTDLTLDFSESPEDQETKIFLDRIQVYNNYGRLLFITNGENEDPILIQRLIVLKSAISSIYRANERVIKEQLTKYQLQIQQYLAINSSASIETIFTATMQLKDAKQKMEQSFANDAEILGRIHKQAQSAVGDLQTLIQEIMTVKDGIATIIAQCKQKLLNTSTSLELSYLEKIIKLKSILTATEISDIKHDPEICDFLDILEQILISLDKLENKELLRQKFTTEIIKILDDLIQVNFANDSDAIPIIQDNQISPISIKSDLKEQCASDLWAVYIISSIFNLAIEQILTNPDALLTKLKIAEQNLLAIQNEIDAEPSELIKTRTITIGKIKQAYQYITYAQKEKSKLIDSIPKQAVSTNTLIAGNLAWAVRPNFNELNYLDQKIEGLRKERFEKQQKYKSETIIIDPLLIRYLQVGVDALKKQQDALNKLKSKIKNDIDKIYRLKLPTDKHETDSSLQNLDHRFKKLQTICDAKYNLIVDKIRPLEKCKYDFTKHILKAYFQYLKLEVDILESETQQQSSDIEQSPKESPKKTLKIIAQKKATITEPESAILKAAKNYSIADLEKHYNQLSLLLKQYLAANEHKTDSNSEQDEIFPMTRTRPQALKVTRVYSDLGSSSYRDLTIFSPEKLESDQQKSLITEVINTSKAQTLNPSL